MKKKSFRTGVFLSYSHADEKWVKKVRVALSPLIQGEKIQIWDDSNIKPGSNWHSEIKKAISKNRVGVLLVSPDFLASGYIAKVELPEMIKQQQNGFTILWIPIRYSNYELTPLNQIQSLIDPSKPLAGLSSSKQDYELVKIAKRIEAAININAVANSLKIIDDLAPEIEANIKNKPIPASKPKYSVTAKQIGDKITIESAHGGPTQVIEYEEMLNLDKNSLKLVRAYERTMKDLFDRWVELKPKSVSRDPAIKKEAKEEANDVRRDLCGQLTELLIFVESMGKQLYDHYGHVRFICGK